jgi:hypothetical protein
VKLFLLPIITILALASLVVPVYPDSRKIKNQVEVSLDITGESAKQILSHYKFKSANRIDYIFDAYDGEKFLLFVGTEKIRFRIKEEESKRIIQLNTNLEFFPRVCEDGTKIMIRVKKNGELDTKNSKYLELTKGNELLELLSKSPSKAIIRLKEFSKTVKSLNVPLQSEIENSFESPNWIYLPINITKKVKWKTKVNFGYGEVIVSISQGKDFIGKDFLQEKWEIEFQVNPKDWKDIGCKDKYCSFEKTVCKFLKLEKNAKLDLTPIKTSPHEKIKAIINPYRKDFGF